MRQHLLPAGFELLRRGDTLAAIRTDYRARLECADCVGADAAAFARAPGACRLGGRGAVFSIPLPPSGERIVVRCSRRGGALAGLLKDRYWGAGRPFQELAVAEAMRAGGVPAQETLAVIAQRAWGPFYRTAIITRQIDGAVDLATYFRESIPREGERRAVVEAVARLARQMHDAGFLHPDLQAQNLLVRRSGSAVEAFVIDLDRARHCTAISRRARERNLFRLNRSIAKLGLRGVTAADRLRFVRAYYASDDTGRDEERRFLDRCVRHLRRHRRGWRSRQEPGRSAFSRVLIVRLGAIGDVVNTLPALSALREALPHAHVAWVVEPAAASLLQGHSMVDEVIVVPRSRAGRGLRRALDVLSAVRAAGDTLGPRRFDLVVDFQGNLRSGLVVRRTRAPLRVGYARGSCREGNWLFTNRRVAAPLRDGHRVERALALLMGLELQIGPSPRPVIPEDPDAERRAEEFAGGLRGGGRRVIAIHAGTSEFASYKQWPASRYIELVPRLCAEMGAAVVLTWKGEGEREAAEAIAGAAEGAVVAPETNSLLELAALLRRCDLFIGSDSGPLHLASAVGTPVVALFGPKDAAVYGPYYGRSKVVEVDLPCRPCKRRRCRDPRCMTQITSRQVFAAAKELL